MKKMIMFAFVAGLFLLTGCESSSNNAPTYGKGVVRVKLETNGLAADVISIKVYVNDELKGTADKNTTDVVVKDIDISNQASVLIQPEFAEIDAPAEKFDFGYSYEYKVGVSSDGGESWSSLKQHSSSINNTGVKPDKYQSAINSAKADIKTATASFAKGVLIMFSLVG